MDKLKRQVLLCCSIFLGLMAHAQQVEIGLLLGASNYSGDLSNESILMKETHMSGSVFGRYNFSPKFAVSGSFGYGRVSGDDKNFTSEKRTYVLKQAVTENFEFNKYRNLNFYSDVYEFSVHAEYNFLPNNLNSYTARQFVPYVFVGLGIFNFNPKSTFNGKVIELQPLATIGQGSTTYNDTKKYPLTALCLPIGLGFRQKIGDDFFLGFEAGVRFTNTNYLDDVGGRYASPSVVNGATGRAGLLMGDRSWELLNGNVDPSATDPMSLAYMFNEGDKRSDKKGFENDIYFMAGVTLSYTIRFRGQGCPTF